MSDIIHNYYYGRRTVVQNRSPSVDFCKESTKLVHYPEDGLGEIQVKNVRIRNNKFLILKIKKKLL